jgi:hypothetical protein
VIFDRDCRACPRLAGFLDSVRERNPDYYCLPVPPFGDTGGRFLIVGLAPGMHGANRTGRPFTGDHAGILLYRMLHRYGFATRDCSASADDGLELLDCRITNAVKCLPPDNKPVGAEINTCNPFLARELAALHREGRWRATGRLQVWPRVAARPGGFHGAGFLPLQPLQHEHGPPDRIDVRRDICRGAGVAG